MPFTRAFSSLGCPELTLEDTIALAERHQIPAVELRALCGTLELPSLLAATYGSPAALAERMRDCRVRIVSLDTSWGLATGASAERERFLEFLPWAEALGVRCLRAFDGNAADPAQAATLAAAAARDWQNLRRERGWQADLRVETHDSLTDTASILAFAEAAPGTAILWDSHHTWRRGEDPVDTWRAIRPLVAHIHVKDSVSRPSARHPVTYVLPGDGEFPIARLLDVLRTDNYSGPLSLEWERMWHPYLPPLDEALRCAEARGWW